jgi:arylsulfatase A-like enzyme
MNLRILDLFPVLSVCVLSLATAGIRFDRFYSAHPMCSPTRASCLSGRSPVRYRCMTWGHDLPLREVTIAEAVRTAGYATGHFGKWHVGGIPHADGGTGRGLPESFCPKPRHPGNQGFDEWFSAGNWYDVGHAYIYHNGQQVPKPFATSVPACTMDFYPTVLDLLGIEMPDQIEPIDGISLLRLIDGEMVRRPKPIPLVSGQAVRLIDNEYRRTPTRMNEEFDDPGKNTSVFHP